MESGRSKQIIAKMIEIIESAPSVALKAGKVAVNKEELMYAIEELSLHLNSEINNYREVTDKKAKIINEAKLLADDIIYEAEKSASRIRVTKRPGESRRFFRSEDIQREEKMALRTANDIFAGSIIYSDEVLSEVNELIYNTYDNISREYEALLRDMRERTERITNNKAELMTTLSDLSKEDKYSQLLEVGQLLANELYYEREKQNIEYRSNKEDPCQLELKLDDITNEMVVIEKKKSKDKSIDEESVLNIDDKINHEVNSSTNSYNKINHDVNSTANNAYVVKNLIDSVSIEVEETNQLIDKVLGEKSIMNNDTDKIILARPLAKKVKPKRDEDILDKIKMRKLAVKDSELVNEDRTPVKAAKSDEVFTTAVDSVFRTLDSAVAPDTKIDSAFIDSAFIDSAFSDSAFIDSVNDDSLLFFDVDDKRGRE